MDIHKNSKSDRIKEQGRMDQRSDLTIINDIGEIFCMETTSYPDVDGPTNPILAFKAVADPDTMYLHQAMKQPDKHEFVNAMSKEVNDQMKNGNFSIVSRRSVPKAKTILQAVW